MDLRIIASMSKVETFTDEQIIFSETDTEYDKMYILLMGVAEVYTNYNSNNQLLLDTLKSGAMFGEMGLFANTKRSATVVAAGEVTAIAITKTNFIKLCKEKPTVVFGLIQIICERLNRANSKLESITKERNNLLGEFNVDIKKYKREVLFPKLHNTPNKVSPYVDENFLYNTKIICPNCTYKYEAKVPSALRMKYLNDIVPDLRRKTIDFDSLWYHLITCPNCLFTTFADYLENNFTFNVKLAEEKLCDIRIKVFESFDLTEKKDLDQVFMSYYLAIISADACDNKKQILSTLWLELSWLYLDNNDIPMYEYATKHAYDAFSDFFSNSTLNKKQDQHFSLILGTLAFRLNEYDNSMRYLTRVKLNKEGSKVYIELAEDIIFTIRDKKDK